MNIGELGARLTAGHLTVEEHIETVLTRLDDLRGTPWENLVASRADHAARAQAAVLGAQLRAGECRGPLHGIAVAVKDNIDVAGMPTRAGSGLYAAAAPAQRDAAIVSALRRAGAIVVAKTHLHELGYGSVGDVNVHGPARHPHDAERITGGSSSGSAALVALGAVPLAVGTDTGCSVRAPAALCGVVGVMPAAGTLSTAGTLPVSTTFDHVGLFTQDVASAASAWASLSAHPPLTTPEPLESLRIGRPVSRSFEVLDPEIDAAVDRSVDRLLAHGATITDIAIPGDDLNGAYSVIVGFEMAERYRAVADAAALQRPTRERLLEKARITPAEYDRARETVHRVRGLVLTEMHAAGIDALALPTVPVRAVPLGQSQIGEETVSSALLRMCVPFSVLGTPAISVPCPASGDLTAGLQLVGITLGEADLLKLAVRVHGC